LAPLTSVALISDIHGNSIALDAVLQDIEVIGGVDEIWALGDLVALGPDPVGVIDRLTSLAHCRFLAGNTERYVITGERPLPSAEEAARRPMLPGLIASFSWAAGQLFAAGRLDWLAALPAELRGELSDGRVIVGVHASPGRDDGEGIHAGLEDAALDAMLREAAADLLFAGHTHEPFSRAVSSGRVTNLGSVSNPTSDPRASYVVVRADRDEGLIEHRRVAYDVAEVMDQLVRQRHPGVGFLEHAYFGAHLSSREETDPLA
jgi:predicted phosphodiesterase